MLSRKVSGYVVPPGSEQGPANQESVVVYNMEGGATGGSGIAENANYNSVEQGWIRWNLVRQALR